MGTSFALESHDTLINEPGNYEIHLKIPKLPLSMGEYSLNLFLSQNIDRSSSSIVTDVRSWTYGNDLTLLVEGQDLASSLSLPNDIRNRRISGMTAHISIRHVFKHMINL